VAAPVIEMHTEVRLACPAELEAPVAPAPVVPDDAAVTGNEAGLRWLGDVIAWGQSLLDRLTDARELCRRG
jgi:hypothetical protein